MWKFWIFSAGFCFLDGQKIISFDATPLPCAWGFWVWKIEFSGGFECEILSFRDRHTLYEANPGIGAFWGGGCGLFVTDVVTKSLEPLKNQHFWITTYYLPSAGNRSLIESKIWDSMCVVAQKLHTFSIVNHLPCLVNNTSPY